METDYRSEFADFGETVYLNAAYQGPLPVAAVRAGQQALEWKALPHTIPEGVHFDLPDRIRQKIASIIGGEPAEIAVTTGASAGMASVAAGMDWRAGDEVLVARGEFPSHFATWLQYARAGKLRMRVIEPHGGFVSARDYIENIGPRTRLVSASLVRFDDGALLDAALVAEACHQAGAALLLDLSQCAGAMPISVRELGADFAVGSGYKWLLGPYGTGFFWVASEWTERLQLGAIYYMALDGARNFQNLPLSNLQPAPGARRWDSPETASFANLSVFDVSLDLILRAGVESIAAHNAALINEIVARLLERRCILASPAESERRGPFVCVAAQRQEKTAELFEKLREAQVIVSLREHALRIAPHIYNTAEQISRLADVLSTSS